MNKIMSKFLISALFLILGGQALAIGMVTEPIVLKDMLRGGEITQTITVLNPEKKPVIYTFGTTGQIEGWAKFFEKNDLKKEVAKFTIPANQYYDVVARITIPKTTPNGKYAGTIFVKQEPNTTTKDEENKVTISQMVSREVTITVSDKEIISWETTIIPESYDVKKDGTLKARVIHENRGNVALKPSLQIKITDLNTEKSVFNAIFPYPEDLDAVVPGEIKNMSDFEWQATGQPEGKYMVNIKTIMGENVLKENSFNFNIGNNFSLDNNKFLASIASIGGGNMVITWIVIGLFLISIILFIKMMINKKAKKETKN